ncbi:NAD(P)-binding protein [Lanmaoa asiatica]|nr:NAD(P)-binding protein [Lanmaoa asiatica]
MSSRPVIIVTGANSGVGFGICHRLLFQLSTSGRDSVSNELELNCDGLTLILACRSKQRADAARAKLYDIADEQVRRAKCSPDYDGHAEIFRKNLHIAIHIIDLADIQSVLHFADEIAQKWVPLHTSRDAFAKLTHRSYPYVSHLICNAGVACFTRIVWPRAFYQLLTDWIMAVTAPKYVLQRVGDMSQDGLGWVWQCNVFGHYALFRALEPVLAKYAAARVVWISSHEASPEFYDPDDWQLVKSECSYQCSKYQVNMISLHLDREAIRSQLDGTPAARHLTVYPGIAGTGIASTHLGTFQTICMFASFYIARLLGSPNHPIDIFKAAISAVYLSLARIACLPSVSGIAGSTNPKEPVEVGTVYTSQTNRRGRDYIGTIKLVQSREEEAQTKELLENCDRLLKTFCDAQGRTSPSRLERKASQYITMEHVHSFPVPLE